MGRVSGDGKNNAAMKKPGETRGRGAPKTGLELLDMYYLHMRSALLETAAGLDRIQRAANGAEALKDKRAEALRKLCQIVGGAEADRTERVLKQLSGE